MFGPPTTTLRRQPIFTASTDCVSIADRRIVCVVCTQLHSCRRTTGGWWFQWPRWLLVSVSGQNWELFAVRGCVRSVSVLFNVRPVFPCLFHAHYQSSFCRWMRSRLRTLTDGSAISYRKLCFLSCDGTYQEFTWVFDSLNMTFSLDWWWWWFPETPFSSVWCLGFCLWFP